MDPRGLKLAGALRGPLLPDDPQKPQRPSRFFDLEKDKAREEIYRPASILRTTEWGLLTFTSLLVAWAFPPYFIQVLILAFFNAGGLFWITYLSEKGRQRLKDFEAEFSVGHKEEEAGHYREAAGIYEKLIPRFQDFPRIAEIAVRHIQALKKKHPQAFKSKNPKKSKSRKKSRS
jgi:hypothetical protein